MNLPNSLSLVRIFMVPVMAAVYLLNLTSTPILLAVVFIAAAITDFLDGHIARKYGMVTDLGKLLDPIADKLLVLFGLFYIAEEGLLPYKLGAICGVIIVGREFLISIVRQVGASKGVIIHANKYGKLKTVFQDVAIPMMFLMPFIGSLLFDGAFAAYKYAAYAVFGLSMVFAIISLAVYLVNNRSIFASE